MANYKVPASIRFEETIWKKLSFIAKKERRSFNAQLEMLAEQYIETYESTNGTIPIDLDNFDE